MVSTRLSCGRAAQVRRVARWSTLALAGWLVVGCGADVSGNAAGVVTTPLSASATQSASAATSASAAVQSGSVQADVLAIEQFDDPATQIRDNADLTSYLLPGIWGPGADCAREQLDPAVILQLSIPQGASEVAGIVTGCIDSADVGLVMAMYGLGLADGGRIDPDVAPCVAEAVATLTTSEVQNALEAIYLARLDLAAPPTSPGIALDFITAETSCVEEEEPSTSAAPTPESSAAPTTSEPPDATRSINWYVLAPGYCLPELPQGDVVKVTVSDCSVPHVSEVVGTSLAPADAAVACDNLFKSYTGQDVGASTFVIDILEAVDSSLAGGGLKVICLATSLSGEPTTGSIKVG